MLKMKFTGQQFDKIVQSVSEKSNKILIDFG